MRIKLFTCFFIFSTTFLLNGGNPKLPDFKPMDVYTLLDLADVWSWKNLDTAFLINQTAWEKAKSSGDRVAEFYTIRERGIYFEKYNRPAEAIPEYENAMRVLSDLKDKNKYLPVIFNDLAIASRKCGQYFECRNYHEKALKIAVETKDLELEEDSYHGIGFLLETVGDWDKAIEWYQKSVTVAEKRGSKKGVVISYQNIANVLQKSGNEQLALEKIGEAWQLAAQTDSARQAHVLHDFGQILAATGNFTEAQAKFLTSLSFYEKLGDRPMMARSLVHIANTHFEKGDFEVAFQFFQKCFQLKDAIRNDDLAQLWLDFGELQSKRNQLKSAENAFSNCLLLAEKYGYKGFLENANQGLGEVFEKEGQINLAYFHQNQAVEISESLQKLEKNRRSAELEFRFTAQKTAETIRELKNRNNQILLGGVAGAAVLFAISFLFLFAQKTRHNQLLKNKNQEIERSNLQLRESNTVLQQFAYATAHDLKEPLRTIGSFVGLLQLKHGASFPPEAIEYFEFVKTGANRMNTLLSDLLEYSTVFMDSPGRGATPIFKGLHEVLGNLHEAIRKSGAVLDLPVEIPLPPVSMPKSHFVQLFQNLLSNAIKFSPENPRIQVLIDRKEPDFFTISIRDNGIGIDKNYSEKIFQIFQRLDKQRFEGAGIGLAICKNIVEKYHGSIWFESELGRGTTFFVRLPVGVEVGVLEMAGGAAN